MRLIQNTSNIKNNMTYITAVDIIWKFMEYHFVLERFFLQAVADEELQGVLMLITVNIFL